jgi:hypothetical protein
MKQRSARWFLVEFGIAFAAGVAGAMIAKSRPGRPTVPEHSDTDVPTPAVERRPILVH